MFNRVTLPVSKPVKKKKIPKPLPVVTQEPDEEEATAQMDAPQLPMALSVAKLAEQLCVSEKMAYWLVHQPGFPSLKVKGRYIVNTKRLQDWLDQHCLPA